MAKCRILVSNITSDKLVPYPGGVEMHNIVCDHTVEGTDNVRRQELMICSWPEYESIMANGWYEVLDEDA